MPTSENQNKEGPRHAFVTGGTGFIGINLIELLIKEGWKVTALHRSESDLSALKRMSVNFLEGSITDENSLTNIFPDNVDVVFHLAGDTNLWHKKNRQQTVTNVRGTQNLLNVSSSRNASAFIYTSSASSWGEMTNRHVSEELPQKGKHSWVNYERTKWLGEQEVLKYRNSGMKVIILNPTTVTGPFDLNNWGKLFLALEREQLPGVPSGTISVTHVREVARAHISAVDKGKNGHHYILSGEDCTIEQFVSEMAAVSGKKKVPGKISTPILKTLAWLQTSASSLTGKKPKLTPELVRLMTRKNITYNCSKAENDLDYRIIPMKNSVKDCYNWLKTEGYLQRDD